MSIRPCVVILVLLTAAHAQERQRRRVEGGDVYLLRELQVETTRVHIQHKTHERRPNHQCVRSFDGVSRVGGACHVVARTRAEAQESRALVQREARDSKDSVTVRSSDSDDDIAA